MRSPLCKSKNFCILFKSRKKKNCKSRAALSSLGRDSLIKLMYKVLLPHEKIF